MALVGIVIGSKTDEEFIKPALDVFREFKIEYDIDVLSAHRKPDKVRQYALDADSKGYAVIIAAAGSAARLPGLLPRGPPCPS